MSPVLGLLSFRGSAGRLSYILHASLALLGLLLPMLLAIWLGVVLELGLKAVARAVYPEGGGVLSRAMLGPWLAILVGTASFVASLWLLTAAGARRLRDLGLPGWPSGVVTGLILIDMCVVDGTASMMAGLVASAATLLLALLPGMSSPNRHGAPRHGA